LWRSVPVQGNPYDVLGLLILSAGDPGQIVTRECYEQRDPHVQDS
jgi:hypothetical protein